MEFQLNSCCLAGYRQSLGGDLRPLEGRKIILKAICARWDLVFLARSRQECPKEHVRYLRFIRLLVRGRARQQRLELLSTSKPPDAPTMPTWPTAPVPAVDSGIEARRELWVQAAKSNPAYNAGTMGTTLRLEATVTPFNPSTYTAKLTDLSSPNSKQLRFKFGKAYGQVDGVNLYGRQTGTSAWTSLGRFNATPANAVVPLANGQPEEWQFQARAVKRDKEIGHASPAMSVIVRG